jgi:hypothetical protein
MDKWKEEFQHTVDDLVLRSNVHECRTSIKLMKKARRRNVEVA